MLKKLTFAVAAVALVAIPVTAHAVPVNFTLDPSQSSVSLIALFGGQPMLEQLPGSGTASYSGTVVVDVDDPFAPTQIELVGGGLATGANFPEPLFPGVDGVVGDPGTPAPSVYGVMLTFEDTPVVLAALRDVSLDVTGPAEAVDGLGDFSSDSHNFTVQSGTVIGWAAAAGIIAFDDLTGEDFGNDVGSPTSSYVVSGNTATLTLVVNSHEPSEEFADFYEGVLVGTATIPEPSSVVLVSLICGMVALMVPRRRR